MPFADAVLLNYSVCAGAARHMAARRSWQAGLVAALSCGCWRSPGSCSAALLHGLSPVSVSLLFWPCPLPVFLLLHLHYYVASHRQLSCPSLPLTCSVPGALPALCGVHGARDLCLPLHPMPHRAQGGLRRCAAALAQESCTLACGSSQPGRHFALWLRSPAVPQRRSQISPGGMGVQLRRSATCTGVPQTQPFGHTCQPFFRSLCQCLFPAPNSDGKCPVACSLPAALPMLSFSSCLFFSLLGF